MSRAALPPVPATLGTPAEYDHTTFERVWPERRQTYVAPTLPEPVQRATEISVDDPLPRNAKTLATLGHARGWSVRITHAVGYDMNEDGSQSSTTVWELTGEMTKGTDKTPPRPAKRKVSETIDPPCESIRVIVVAPGNKRFVGHWKNNGWDFGLILDGRTLVRNCNWTQLKEALDAEGREDLRDTQLPLQGDDGKPL